MKLASMPAPSLPAEALARREALNIQPSSMTRHFVFGTPGGGPRLPRGMEVNPEPRGGEEDVLPSRASLGREDVRDRVSPLEVFICFLYNKRCFPL